MQFPQFWMYTYLDLVVCADPSDGYYANHTSASVAG